MKPTLNLLVVALAVGLVSCTAGGTGAPNITQTNPHDPRFSALQLAVGTVNLYGTGNPGLNVVSTLRQPDGTSAVGVNTPSLSGPFTFAVAAVPGPAPVADPFTMLFVGGPSLSETTAPAPAITGTSQTIHIGSPFCDTTTPVAGFVTCLPGHPVTDTTFGQSGGVFANGFGPYNAVAEFGQAWSYQPYPQPIYASGGGDNVHQFLPWGGPPAFDPPKPGFPNGDGMGMRDGIVIPFTDNFGNLVPLGMGLGTTIFEWLNPGAGQYTLSTQIGTLNNSGQPNITTVTANANLTSLALLPTLTTPVVTPDANGDGGATFTATVPAGVTEALVQIVDYGPGGGPANGGASNDNCQGPKGTHAAPVYYSVFITSSGTYQLGTSHGPNTNLTGGATNLTPSHSICTLTDNQSPPDGSLSANAGDNFTVEMVGFDYPAYEMAVSLAAATVPQRPVLAGANGQADITVSPPQEEDYPNYTTPIPLRAASHPLMLRRQLMSGGGPFMLPPWLARELGIPIR